MKQYYVYFMSDKPRGTLYIGVTGDLIKRAYEHRCGAVDGFTKKYGLHSLVYYEEYTEIQLALQREKNLKRWLKNWKLELIEQENPSWVDLWHQVSAT